MLDAAFVVVGMDGEPQDPVEGVSRVQAVYTPLERRNRGYAGARVGDLSKYILNGRNRCILYTDLGNPISDSV